jgi:hypothetical protein
MMGRFWSHSSLEYDRAGVKATEADLPRVKSIMYLLEPELAMRLWIPLKWVQLDTHSQEWICFGTGVFGFASSRHPAMFASLNEYSTTAAREVRSKTFLG